MPRYVRIVIQLPADLKQRLDAMRSEGYTASGFIRSIVERELIARELLSSSDGQGCAQNRLRDVTGGNLRNG